MYYILIMDVLTSNEWCVSVCVCSTGRGVREQFHVIAVRLVR